MDAKQPDISRKAYCVVMAALFGAFADFFAACVVAKPGDSIEDAAKRAREIGIR